MRTDEDSQHGGLSSVEEEVEPDAGDSLGAERSLHSATEGKARG